LTSSTGRQDTRLLKRLLLHLATKSSRSAREKWMLRGASWKRRPTRDMLKRRRPSKQHLLPTRTQTSKTTLPPRELIEIMSFLTIIRSCLYLESSTAIEQRRGDSQHSITLHASKHTYRHPRQPNPSIAVYKLWVSTYTRLSSRAIQLRVIYR